MSVVVVVVQPSVLSSPGEISIQLRMEGRGRECTLACSSRCRYVPVNCDVVVNAKIVWMCWKFVVNIEVEAER